MWRLSVVWRVATEVEESGDQYRIALAEQMAAPFAMFECKRVGIEEGMKKGPQTIEKAKQGAYVARAVSSLHKIRGTMGGCSASCQGRTGHWRANHTTNFSRRLSRAIHRIGCAISS